ncbi:MAG: hypothetical protein R3F43_12080 [bacterium]
MAFSLAACGADSGTDDLGSALDRDRAGRGRAGACAGMVDQADEDARRRRRTGGRRAPATRRKEAPARQAHPDFCNKSRCRVLARCEARLAEGGELPEQAESCEDVATAPARCVRAPRRAPRPPPHRGAQRGLPRRGAPRRRPARTRAARRVSRGGDGGGPRLHGRLPGPPAAVGKERRPPGAAAAAGG